MCLFLQFSEREISHKTLPPFSQQKRKEEEEEKTWWKKVNLSSVVGYTFIYICEACVCVYERRCDDDGKIVFRRNPMVDFSI